WGFKLGQGKLEDSLMVALLDTYCGCYMATTAENLGRKHGITREDQDEFALRSQKLARTAWEAGRFRDEVVPVERFERDDHMRSDTTLEGLAKLKPAFSKDGFVTAGNASGIVNGGAIALGHPLGASGTRLTMTVLYELKRRKKRYGLAAACIGGGQGIAIIVEAL